MNSVFYDPSIYGRFLVVGILASLVLVLYRRGARSRGSRSGPRSRRGSGSSRRSRSRASSRSAVGIVVALTVLWRRRAVLPLLVALACSPSSLRRAAGPPPADRRRASRMPPAAARSSSQRGRDRRATTRGRRRRRRLRARYAERRPPEGEGPKAAASHNTPITVAAETGLPGLALLAWLVVAALVSVPAQPVATETGRARLGVRISLGRDPVHSLFYNALLEDPLFWALLGARPRFRRERRGGTRDRLERVLVLAPHTDDGEFGCGGRDGTARRGPAPRCDTSPSRSRRARCRRASRRRSTGRRRPS